MHLAVVVLLACWDLLQLHPAVSWQLLPGCRRLCAVGCLCWQKLLAAHTPLMLCPHGCAYRRETEGLEGLRCQLVLHLLGCQELCAVSSLCWQKLRAPHTPPLP